MNSDRSARRSEYASLTLAGSALLLLFCILLTLIIRGMNLSPLGDYTSAILILVAGCALFVLLTGALLQNRRPGVIRLGFVLACAAVIAAGIGLGSLRLILQPKRYVPDALSTTAATAQPAGQGQSDGQGQTVPNSPQQ